MLFMFFNLELPFALFRRQFAPQTVLEFGLWYIWTHKVTCCRLCDSIL